MKSRGFTIVELLIATTVFSVILLMASAGVIYVGRTYVKGINSSRTQEAARSIIDEISREIQFSGGDVVETDGDSFCIGDKQYGYTPGLKLVASVTDASIETNEALYLANEICGDPAPLTVKRELLSQNMRLATFSITDKGDNTYQISIKVIYGDEELSPSGVCLQRGSGGEYCAVSGLTTLVQKRIQ